MSNLSIVPRPALTKFPFKDKNRIEIIFITEIDKHFLLKHIKSSKLGHVLTQLPKYRLRSYPMK